MDVIELNSLPTVLLSFPVYVIQYKDKYRIMFKNWTNNYVRIRT